MGLASIASKIVSVAIQAPRFFGAISPVAFRVSPKGNTLLDTALKGDVRGVFVDAREVLGGIDDHGRMQVGWLKETWTPVIVVDLTTRALEFTRKLIAEAFS